MHLRKKYMYVTCTLENIETERKKSTEVIY